jgi:hypothetical protein
MSINPGIIQRLPASNRGRFAGSWSCESTAVIFPKALDLSMTTACPTTMRSGSTTRPFTSAKDVCCSLFMFTIERCRIYANPNLDLHGRLPATFTLKVAALGLL